MAEEEAVHIRVTGKQLGIALAALVALIGGYPLANSINSNVRNDPFTGADGKLINKRIDRIERQIEFIKHDIEGCQSAIKAR